MKKIISVAFGVRDYDMSRARTYKSRISPEHLRRHWKMNRDNSKPITILDAEALDLYFSEAKSLIWINCWL